MISPKWGFSLDSLSHPKPNHTKGYQFKPRLHQIFSHDCQAQIYKTIHTCTFKFHQVDYILSVLDNNKSTASQLSLIICKPLFYWPNLIAKRKTLRFGNALAKNMELWFLEPTWKMRARIMHDAYTSVQADKLCLILLSSPLNYPLSSGYVLDLCMLS